MEYFHSLTSLSAVNLANKFKKQIHYVLALLQVANKIITWNKSEDKNTLSYPYLYIVGENNSFRAFIVKSDSIVSFLFPLGLSKNVDANGNEMWIVNKRDLVLTTPIISKCIEFANSISQKKNPSKIIDIAKNITNIDVISNNAFDLLEYLILIEPCYLRFDNDPQHAKKFLHPKSHLDINFSIDGTYKIGVFKQLKIDDLKDVLEKSTNCWFAIKPNNQIKSFVAKKRLSQKKQTLKLWRKMKTYGKISKHKL